MAQQHGQLRRVIPNWLRYMTAYPARVGGVVFFVLMVVVALITLNQRDNSIALKKSAALQDITAVGVRLESLILANVVALKELQAAIYNQPSMSKKALIRLIKPLIESPLQIRHIAVAPGLVVDTVYPLKGNESAVGLNYRLNKAQYPAVKQAMQTNQILLAGPLELVQGGQALIFRLPIVLPDSQKHWGLVASVVNLDGLMRKAGVLGLSDSLLLGIKGKDGLGRNGAMVWGEASVFDKASVSQQLDLPYGHWAIAAMPKNGWAAGSGMLVTMTFAGFILSLLLSLIIYALLKTQGMLRHMLAENDYRANYDCLTGLCNRSYFQLQLKGLLEQCHRYQRKFAIIYIDLDRFKHINDAKGHEAGDKVLQLVSARLKALLRSSDIVARIGGDEFVIVMPDFSEPEDIEILAKKINASLSQPMPVCGHMLSLGASQGIAVYPQDGKDLDSLVHHADRAMYYVKKQGRNGFCFSNEALRNEVLEHQQMLDDIITSLNNHWFDIYYQPIVGEGAQAVMKCEALIRWRHPKRGFVVPEKFIPFAQANGLINRIGQYVLTQVCLDWNYFSQQGHVLDIGVNFSSSEFAIDSIEDTWLAIIRYYNVPCNHLVFEITESVFMEGNVSQLAALNSLKQAGVKLAIDDFCTGYSALHYLQLYPTDYLKIDKCYIDTLCHSHQSKEIIHALLVIAKALRITVIAEGVETPAQMKLLSEMHCDYQQGFYFAKPMAREKFLAFIETKGRRRAVVS